MQTATRKSVPAGTATNREPDIILDVVEWKGEAPAETAMVSATGSAKFQRDCVVLDKDGKPAIVTVVGTERQWEVAGESKIEGYLGSDKTRIYFQPSLGSAASNAARFI
jgi:hypothetical protein